VRKKVSLFLLAALTALSLTVVASTEARAADCVSTTGIVCGGEGLCCFAGFNFCIAWDCSY